MGDLARTGIPRNILDEISPPAMIRVTQRGSPPTPTGNPYDMRDYWALFATSVIWIRCSSA